MLFCVYIDELLKRLEREGHGCWVGNHFYGAFSYADGMNTMQNSNNPKVTNIVQVCKNTASSIISMNSDFISNHLGVERTAVWDLNKVKSTRKGLTEGDQTTVEIIKNCARY